MGALVGDTEYCPNIAHRNVTITQRFRQCRSVTRRLSFKLGSLLPTRCDLRHALGDVRKSTNRSEPHLNVYALQRDILRHRNQLARHKFSLAKAAGLSEPVDLWNAHHPPLALARHNCGVVAHAPSSFNALST